MSLNPKLFYKGWLHTGQDPDGPPPDTGRRWTIFKLLIVLAFTILAIRLWYLQIVDGPQYREMARNNSIRLIPIEPPRGLFYDRNGKQLVYNVPKWKVYLTLSDMPEDESHYQEVLNRLESWLHLGAVVYVNGSMISNGNIDAVSRVVAQRLGLAPEEVADVIKASKRDESPKVLLEDIPSDRLASIRKSLEGIQGFNAVLRLQWLVEHSGVPPFQPVEVAEGVPRDVALSIESQRVLLPGVSIEYSSSRDYPQGPVFSNLIGYTGKILAEQLDYLQSLAKRFGQDPYRLDATVGRAALEFLMEPYLRGVEGHKEVEVTSTNRVVREGDITNPVPGDNVVLSIDSDLQKFIYEQLSSAVKQSGAKSGAAVVIDPQNGDVLSMVSFPSYDNNAFIGGISYEEYNKLQQDPGAPLLDKAISGMYMPGSVLKPYIAAAGLAEGAIRADTKLQCGGYIDVPVVTSASGIVRQRVYDWSTSKVTKENVIGALSKSCDIFFYLVSAPSGQIDIMGRPLRYYPPGAELPVNFQGIGIESVNKYLRTFGFGQRTGIDLNGESSGLLADAQWKEKNYPDTSWTVFDTLNTGVGRGYTLVTPIQVAAATASVANGGTLYKPRLVLRIVDPRGKTVKEFAPEVRSKSVVSSKYLDIIRQAMLQSLQSGAASYLRTRGLLSRDIDAGVMVGTPPAVLAKHGMKPISWFTAFAPYTNSKVSIAVVIDGVKSGSDPAPEVGAKIINYYLERNK